MLYPYPGNYAELSSLIEQSVLHSKTDMIGISELPIDPKMIAEVSQNMAALDFGISENRLSKEKERRLYSVLMAKTENNLAQVADYLDVPESILTQWLEEIN